MSHSTMRVLALLVAGTLSACGGGSDSGTSANTNTSPTTTTTSTNPGTAAASLDLKSIEGAQNAGALAFNLAGLSTLSGDMLTLFSGASWSNSSPCAGGGSNQSSFVNVNANGLLNPGNTLTSLYKDCVTSDVNGTTRQSGTSTLTLASLAGDAGNASGAYTGTLNLDAAINGSFDGSFKGVHYEITSGVQAIIGSFVVAHDGKGTASLTDDTDTATTNLNINASGMTGGQAINQTASVSSVCTFYADHSVTCPTLSVSAAGTSAILGNLKISAQVTSPIVFKSGDPVSGTITVTQDGDSSKFTFVSSASGTVVNVTSANGATSQMSLAAFTALGIGLAN